MAIGVSGSRVFRNSRFLGFLGGSRFRVSRGSEFMVFKNSRFFLVFLGVHCLGVFRVRV